MDHPADTPKSSFQAFCLSFTSPWFAPLTDLTKPRSLVAQNKGYVYSMSPKSRRLDVDSSFCFSDNQAPAEALIIDFSAFSAEYTCPGGSLRSHFLRKPGYLRLTKTKMMLTVDSKNCWAALLYSSNVSLLIWAVSI